MIRGIKEKLIFNGDEFMDYINMEDMLKEHGYKCKETTVMIYAEKEYAYPTTIEVFKEKLGEEQ